MAQVGEGREGKKRSQRAAQQPQQHHRCPRCDSLNTKFCYFNNYSLSQPRHFCKACKRYWTQGGTFRNIPVGGRSRKTKRDRTCSSLSSNNSHPQQPQPHLTSSSPSTMIHSTTPYYQLISPNPSQLFNDSFKTVMDSSNSPHLSGFNSASLPPLFYQVGNRDSVNSVYSAEQGIPSNLGNNSISANSRSDHWPQTFVNNATNHRASSGAFSWSTINATSTGGNSGQNNMSGGSSSSLNPNHWHDLPGYRPPQ